MNVKVSALLVSWSECLDVEQIEGVDALFALLVSWSECLDVEQIEGVDALFSETKIFGKFRAVCVFDVTPDDVTGEADA
jgi:hypothetical protein